jgi:glycosyltransferase
MIVSIITVVKNDSKNIEKTINSVWRQNYKNLEHIIIDGKSIDGTYDIIKKNKKKVSIFKSSKDNNLYDALNKGIKLSAGNIIGILHSGDLYANKNVIRKSVSFMRENNLDFVISNLNMIDKNNKVLRHVNTSNYFKKIITM